MDNLQARGRRLIEVLKSHIIDVFVAIPRGERLNVEQIRETSGLDIQATTGEHVWDKAIVTLLVELVKEGRLQSSELRRPRESKYAAKAQYSMLKEV